VVAWFTGRLPQDWLATPPVITVDDDEILVVVSLDAVALDKDVSPEDQAVAESARVSGFREDTREQRMRIADEAQSTFGRFVSWGASSGETTVHFTTVSAPVMTRLRIAERQILDTLIDAGVARSRSEALAWCVRLVGRNEEEWINDIRTAFEQVEEVRTRGPRSAGSEA
jgi:hypothetical protein